MKGPLLLSGWGFVCLFVCLSLGLVLRIKANSKDQYSHLNFAVKMNEMKVLFVEESYVLFTWRKKAVERNLPQGKTFPVDLCLQK